MISKGYKILKIFCISLFTFSKFVIPVVWRDFPSEFWAHSLKNCPSVQRPSHIVFSCLFFFLSQVETFKQSFQPWLCLPRRKHLADGRGGVLGAAYHPVPKNAKWCRPAGRRVDRYHWVNTQLYSGQAAPSKLEGEALSSLKQK